ncbi:MAG TPA: hypothetical protein VGI45_33850 [Terracidiphilus sp.]|jgi:hypothetical protein
MNLITRSFGGPSTGPVQLSLMLRPSCGLPGDYEFPTDSASLIRMLRSQTDLPGSVLQRFEDDLRSCTTARLLGVELSESVLTNIGYFID